MYYIGKYTSPIFFESVLACLELMKSEITAQNVPFFPQIFFDLPGRRVHDGSTRWSQQFRNLRTLITAEGGRWKWWLPSPWTGVDPKIGGKPPKWMVSNGKNLLKWMTWGENPTILGNIHLMLLRQKIMHGQFFCPKKSENLKRDLSAWNKKVVHISMNSIAVRMLSRGFLFDGVGVARKSQYLLQEVSKMIMSHQTKLRFYRDVQRGQNWSHTADLGFFHRCFHVEGFEGSWDA